MASDKVELRLPYCASLAGILKWLAILFSAVVLFLLCWEAIRHRDEERLVLLKGEHYTIVVACFTVVIELVFLIIAALNLHNSICATCRCRTLALWIYLLCFCLWVAAASVQTWVCTELKKEKIKDETGFWSLAKSVGVKLHEDMEFFNRRASAAAFCFLNVLVFGAAVHQARTVDV